jgi:hypothetical protein
MWYVFLTVLFLAILLWQDKSNKKTKTAEPKTAEAEDQGDQKHDYTNSYKPKWLFSYNEKDAYSKIKAVTDELGMTLLAKVRLFDLVEPKKGSDNYKGAMWKVQAKHVDFVICDQKLVARYVIELDDGSHEAEARQERDEFVTSVLQNCEYKVLHVKAVNQEQLKAWLK